MKRVDPVDILVGDWVMVLIAHRIMYIGKVTEYNTDDDLHLDHINWFRFDMTKGPKEGWVQLTWGKWFKLDENEYNTHILMEMI